MSFFQFRASEKYFCREAFLHTFVYDVVNCLRSMSHTSEPCLTEVIRPDDKQAKSAEIKKAFPDGIGESLSRGCFKIIKKFRASHNKNILPCNYVLTTRYNELESRRYKAHFALGEHGDRLKAHIVHTSQTAQPWSSRLKPAIFEMHNVQLWSDDAPQVHTQADKPLAQQVTIDDVQP